MVDVRIIGGELRGRKIQLAKNSQLRPTMSRIRETLFNWLAGELYGKRCLDVFAGSGVLGFEALSRGASDVVFIEKHKATAQAIRSNIEQFNCSDVATVKAVDSLSLLKSKLEKPFDIVFLDPPFNQNLLKPTIDLLLENDCLTDDAWVYLEAETGADIHSLSDAFSVYRMKATSQIQYCLLQRNDC